MSAMFSAAGGSSSSKNDVNGGLKQVVVDKFPEFNDTHVLLLNIFTEDPEGAPVEKILIEKAKTSGFGLLGGGWEVLE